MAKKTPVTRKQRGKFSTRGMMLVSNLIFGPSSEATKAAYELSKHDVQDKAAKAVRKEGLGAVLPTATPELKL